VATRGVVVRNDKNKNTNYQLKLRKGIMAEFNPDEMIARFKDRAQAVRKRPLPPVAGEERQLFLAQAQTDFQDFAIIGDAQAAIEDGVLVLRIDLRPS
jgi:hypothetical protein